MVASNEVYYEESWDKWYCCPCERVFVSEQAIHTHCRNAGVHSGEWCTHCEWLFVSQAAMTDHLRDSSHHNICDKCHIDYASRTDYVDHLESEHFWCRRCQRHTNDRWGHESQALLRAHQVKEHFMCAKCDTYFENQNNVDQHQRVHLPRNKECYGCYRKFPDLSSMMIHLESGNCSSRVTLNEIDSWALMFPECGSDGQSPNPYACPRCRRHRFTYLSGLLQHLESNACEGTIEREMPHLPTYLKDMMSEHASERQNEYPFYIGISL